MWSLVLIKLRHCGKNSNAYKIAIPRSIAKSPLQKAMAKRSTIATIFGALNQAGNNGTARVQMRGTRGHKFLKSAQHFITASRIIVKTQKANSLLPRESLSS